MDKKQTATVLKVLTASYPNRAAGLDDPEVAKVWHAALQDLDYQAVQVAVRKWTMTEKWPPAIADIREMATADPNQLDWAEAWEQVNHVVRCIGPYNQEEALGRLDEVTRATVQRIGYQTLCRMESKEHSTMRAQFRDIYNQITERKRLDAQLPAILTSAEMHERIEATMKRRRVVENRRRRGGQA